MTYTFQLNFGGLCLFHVQNTGNRSPHVLLVKASDPDNDDDLKKLNPKVRPHPHKPRLVVDPRYLDGSYHDARKPDGIVVDPNGMDYRCFDIEHQEIDIQLPGGGSALEVPRGRRPPSSQPYRSPKDLNAVPTWFDWTISVPHVSKTGSASPEVNTLKAKCWLPNLSDLDCPVITRVKLPKGGKLETIDHSRAGGSFMAYYYETLNGCRSTESAHVFSDRVALNVEGIDKNSPVVLDTGASGKIYLKPGKDEAPGSVAIVSITNFDAVLGSKRGSIYDFLWYYKLYEWTGGRPNVMDWPLPHPEGTVGGFFTPSTTTCPPGSG